MYDESLLGAELGFDGTSAGLLPENFMRLKTYLAHSRYIEDCVGKVELVSEPDDSQESIEVNLRQDSTVFSLGNVKYLSVCFAISIRA